MDWNLKEAAAPIWDFTEFPPQETTLLLDGLSSGSVTDNRDLSVDLKLGQVSNGGVVVSEKVVGPTKRARGTVNNNVVCQGQAVCCCLVDGCDADLSRSREYHRRHKVCELHSKTPEVTIGGHKQRFCQQCSRFHSLEEFDEGKRSCRKRLEGHNRRRRKPQPDPPLVNCLSNYQGGRSRASPSYFSNTNHIYSSASAAAGNQHTTWLGGGAHYNQQIHCFHNIPTLLSSSSSSSLETTIFGGSSQTLPPSRGVSGSSNDQNMYYFQPQDADCALSLLSSPSPQMMQQLGIHQQGTSSSSYSTSAAATTTHCTTLFGDNSPPQTLPPFHWD